MWAVNGVFLPFTEKVLGASPAVCGWSISAYFGADTLTSMVLERHGQKLQQSWMLYAGYLAGALIWIGYTLPRSVPVVQAVSVLDGLVFTFALTIFDIRVQAEAPDARRRRVCTAVRGLDQGVTIAAELAGGFLADRGSIVGSRHWASGISVCLLLGTLFLGLRWGTVPRPAERASASGSGDSQIAT